MSGVPAGRRPAVARAPSPPFGFPVVPPTSVAGRKSARWRPVPPPGLPRREAKPHSRCAHGKRCSDRPPRLRWFPPEIPPLPAAVCSQCSPYGPLPLWERTRASAINGRRLVACNHASSPAYNVRCKHHSTMLFGYYDSCVRLARCSSRHKACAAVGSVTLLQRDRDRRRASAKLPAQTFVSVGNGAVSRSVCARKHGGQFARERLAARSLQWKWGTPFGRVISAPVMLSPLPSPATPAATTNR